MNGHPEGADLDTLSGRVTELLEAGQKIAYAVISPELDIRYISPNFSEILGDVRADVPVVGTPVTETVWEFVGAEPSLVQVMHGEISTYQLDRVNRHSADGSVRYLNLRAVPFAAGDPARGLLILIEDETMAGVFEQQLVQDRNELRLAQSALERAHTELQRLDRLKSLFLSIVVHDMRAPLTAILGYTELVRAGLSSESPENHAEFLAIVSSQVQWLSRLTADLLDLEQLERGNLKINIQDCDLTQLVKTIFASLSESARIKGLNIGLEFAEAEIGLQADPDRVQQILYNLLGNAIKYTPENGEIRIQTKVEEAYGVFSVWNSGPGLTDEEQAHLFQLYYRTEDARRSQVRGSGLGLFIVKSLVDAQNGMIEVSSGETQGTNFTVRLPLAPDGDGGVNSFA